MQGNTLYQGEPVECWIDKDSEERAKQTICYTVGESSRHYDQFRRNCDDWYDRYTNQPLKLRQSNRIRSNVPSGIVSEMVDSVRADMMDKITKKRPYVQSIAREMGDFDSARLQEALIQFDFDQMKFWNIVDPALTSACVWGTALAKVMYEERVVRVPLQGISGADGRSEMVDMPGYKGPVIVPCFVYDVFPHPQKIHPDDPFPIVHISYENYDDLEMLADAGVYEKTAVRKIPDMQYYSQNDKSAAYMPLRWDDLQERVDQRMRMGWTTDSRLDPDGVMVCECECMFRHKLNEAPVRTIITMANGIVIRVAPSPLRDGTSVWLAGKIMNVPGQFYGHSLVQKNKPQVHVAEVALNMVLQNLATAVNRMKIIDPSQVMNPQSFDDAPNGNIFVKPNHRGLDNVVKTLDPVSVAQDGFRMMDWGQSRADAVSSNMDLKSGRVSGGERTATASNLAFTQASVRFKHMLGWFGESYLLPAVEKMTAYNRDYLDQEYVFRIVGQAGIAWKPVSQQDLAVNVEWVFLGPTRDENEAMQISQLENMLKIVSPMMALPWAQSVMQEITVLLADKFDFPDMEKLKELMGYGQPQQPMMEPGMESSGGPSRRQDRRLGSGGPPTNMQGIAKSLGGLLANTGGPR